MPTNVRGIRVPTGTDRFDVPADMQTMAQDVVARGGDTMTGQLTINADIVMSGSNLHCAGGSGNFGWDLSVGRNLVLNGLPAAASIANMRWLLNDNNGTTFALPETNFRLAVAGIAQSVSSRRFKTKVTKARSTPDVTALQPHAFQWKKDGVNDVIHPGERLGLIAEEVAEVDERLVTRNAEGEIQGLDTNALIAALVTKVSELQTRIDVLEGQSA